MGLWQLVALGLELPSAIKEKLSLIAPIQNSHILAIYDLTAGEMLETSLRRNGRPSAT